jgi:hypothetical protein
MAWQRTQRRRAKSTRGRDGERHVCGCCYLRAFEQIPPFEHTVWPIYLRCCGSNTRYRLSLRALASVSAKLSAALSRVCGRHDTRGLAGLEPGAFSATIETRNISQQYLSMASDLLSHTLLLMMQPALALPG